MTVYAITDTKKGRTWIVPTYLQTTPYPQFFLPLFFPYQTGWQYSPDRI